MNKFFRFLLLVTFIVLLDITGAQAQKTPDVTWQMYSPVGAAFALTIPGNALPSGGHIFDPKGSVDVYRLIEPGKDVRAFNFETALNGKRWFLGSILQISRKTRKIPRLLADSKASVINTIIGDDLTTSTVVTKKIKDRVTFQWFYKRVNIDLSGVVLVKITATHAIVLVIDCNSCEPHSAEIQRVLSSL